MTSQAVFDIENLLHPISEDSPTGIDLREDSSPDSLYYKIKDARNSARSDERKNLFEFSAEANELWRTVLELAPKILSEHSKDLEITSWYIEALIRLKGFAGLKDGFLLLKQLVESFWDDIYPLPDEDGLETTVAPLAGLNGQGAEGVLIAPIRRVLITEGDSPGPFGFWQYQQALDVQKIVDDSERNKKFDSLGFSLADIEKSVTASSETFFINQRDDLELCISTYKEIGRILDDKCGAQVAPSISNITETLQQCLGAIKHLGQHKLPMESIDQEIPSEVGDVAESNEIESVPQQTGPIRNREHAFEQLRVISDYFLKTEPHSPISYSIDKVIKWGNMPLTELINELIPDGGSRQFYESLTGVKSNSLD
ncbi:type VI secretion system protein TssA [Aliikangiella sp. G2MR2-5]|uniref:type VI secretion system protein TssA n=1 Tax=Aliikangiella sp. G2MR2-5 TaxID=2788943 RepID=UPI0018AC438F|nr:type VI secretion system protein TssA [Aliikangiella sp. G2MR2-5]